MGVKSEGREGGTATSAFGVGRRESHDASAFYARFQPPELSDDQEIVRASLDDPFLLGDARDMSRLPNSSVALVVTSPPYFVGKEYEQALGQGHVPGSYLEYLELLRDVFAACKDKLEPGGRIAVNVANLGRKPYRSLSADVIRILQDDLGLLLRGEVLWVKGEGATGSCAWGSFRSAANPVLRDLSERVIIASKGRFARARTIRQREREDLPSVNTVSTDEFMAATLDVWRIPAESARRVGHPAPFPVALPQRLIELYTYRDDLVLDPFLGSGSTMVAAARTGRRYVGFDTDPEYIELARQRVQGELERLRDAEDEAPPRARERTVLALAEELLHRVGFSAIRAKSKKSRNGLDIPLLARDQAGNTWAFDVSGGFTVPSTGLARTETVWRSLGWAHALRCAEPEWRVALLSSSLPKPGSAADKALRTCVPRRDSPLGVYDALRLGSPETEQRLSRYAQGTSAPLPGFWRAKDLKTFGGG